MGGHGSGRYARSEAAATVESRQALDIRVLARNGALSNPGMSDWRWHRIGRCTASARIHTDSQRITLYYRHTLSGESRVEIGHIDLTWTDCHLGGQRAWMLCPRPCCGRRVAILYAWPFACRRCHSLTYESQRAPAHDRHLGRIERIRQQLGWPPGLFNPQGGKPEGMRRNRYWRLVIEHNRLAAETFEAISKFWRLPSSPLVNRHR